MAIPSWIGEMSTVDAENHGCDRNQFCVTVGHVTRTTGILT